MNATQGQTQEFRKQGRMELQEKGPLINVAKWGPEKRLKCTPLARGGSNGEGQGARTAMNRGRLL